MSHKLRPQFGALLRFKSIILNNLYGVDIMEEATEICKLRLFLKLVAQVERVENMEPLPDIDFNIRAGNTLVGYVSLKDVKLPQTASGRLDFDGAVRQIDKEAKNLDRLFSRFREQQTEIGGEVTVADKAELRKRLKALEDELNDYMAGEYDIKPRDKPQHQSWLDSHKPFHWFIEFYHIMSEGGFDVIIGNPPYVVYPSDKVEYAVRESQYSTIDAKNLYALVFERSFRLGSPNSYVSLIVQLTSICSERLATFQRLLIERGTLDMVPFPRRPESVFDGVEMPVVILVSHPVEPKVLYTTRIDRFYTEERQHAIATLVFADHSLHADRHRIPKIGSTVEENLYRKVVSNTGLLASLTCQDSKWLLYYQEACRYWAKATYGLPYFRRNKQKVDPPHGRVLYFESSEACSFAFCLANSSLFYWLYSTLCDCEHINDSFVRGFRIPDEWSRSDWTILGQQLMKSLRENATRKVISTKQGHTIEYDEIKALHSKPIIDKVDRMLANHYGLTDEELDFIVNYDIKYRMGREAGEEEQP